VGDCRQGDTCTYWVSIAYQIVTRRPAAVSPSHTRITPCNIQHLHFHAATARLLQSRSLPYFAIYSSIFEHALSLLPVVGASCIVSKELTNTGCYFLFVHLSRASCVVSFSFCTFFFLYISCILTRGAYTREFAEIGKDRTTGSHY